MFIKQEHSLRMFVAFHLHDELEENPFDNKLMRICD